MRSGLDWVGDSPWALSLSFPVREGGRGEGDGRVSLGVGGTNWVGGGGGNKNRWKRGGGGGTV